MIIIPRPFRSRNTTMPQPAPNRPHPPCNVRGDLLHLLKVRPGCRGGPSDLGDEHGPRQTSSAGDGPLRTGDGDIITDDDQVGGDVWVRDGGLFAGETKVEDVAGAARTEPDVSSQLRKCWM